MKIKPKVQRKLELLSKQSWSSAASVVRHLGGRKWFVRGLGIGHGADCQVHICLGDASAGSRRGGRQRVWPPAGGAVLLPHTRPRWAGMRVALWVLWLWGWISCPPVCRGLHRRAPKPPGLRCFSQNPVFTLPASEHLLFLFFYLRLLCPRLRIRETTETPTAMKTHEGLLTSSSLCPIIPDRAEQGVGPRGRF